MIQTIIKVGNSQGIIIPKQILKKLGLVPGQKLSVDVDLDAKNITLRLPDSKPPSTITPEFRSWLDEFKKKNYRMLKELAKTP